MRGIGEEMGKEDGIEKRGIGEENGERRLKRDRGEREDGKGREE